jgi:CHRD domain
MVMECAVPVSAMALNRRVAVAVMGIGFGWFGLSLAAQSAETFKSRLSAVPADARTRADLAGSGSASAVLTGAKLAITGSFEGLRTAATAATLHSSVAAGVKGPAIGNLTMSKATSGTITGSVDLTSQQLTSLRKGGLYVQIHSEKAPDGVLWGWLLK